MGDPGKFTPPNPMDTVRASDVRANVPFVYLTVDDMARSLTFYQHLGFTFPLEAFGEPHVEAELKNGLFIFWNHIDYVRIYAPDYHPAPHGRAGLAFQLESPAAVDALFHKLNHLGYQVDRTPWDSPWGHRYAIVYDPDGNALNIFAPHT
ncbi:MAG TPA: VOC family protein [Acidimicrobiales bacterium]